MGEIQRIEDIRALVDRRVKEEEEKYPPPKKDGGGSDEPPLDFVRQCYNSNEVGDSILYNYFCKDRFAYNVISTRWMYYVGPHWEIDRDGRALAAIETTVVKQYLRLVTEKDQQIDEAIKLEENAKVKALRKLRGYILDRIDRLRSAAGRKNTLSCAASNLEPLTIHELDFDTDPWLLACANGVINLRTGDFREGKPGDYITKCAPVTWQGIDEQCPEFEKFLDECLAGNKEVIAFLNRLLGYSITGAHHERLFVMLYGKYGQNGKGTLIEVLYSLLGPVAGPIQAEMLMSQHVMKNSSSPSPDIMSLKGMRLVWASEPEEGNRFATGRIKWISGGDPLTGRNPNDREMTKFMPTHTPFILTNYKPHAPAHDKAFWERLLLIDFPFTFVKNRDPAQDWERKATAGLAEKLMQESSGIMAWLVRGCLAYQNNEKGLDPPECVRQAVNDYQRDEDTLADFIEASCDVGPEYDEFVSALYTAYKSWWENVAGSKPMTQRKFGDMLSMKFKKIKTSGKMKYYGIQVSVRSNAP